MKSNEIQNQDMQKSLCYDYQLGQDCIATTMSADKTAKEYYDYIARTLGCEIPELANLLPNEAFVHDANCGCRVEDFFPVGSHIEVTVITTDFTTSSGFSFGEVLQIVYNGEKFIADRKAGGRCGVFGKYEFNESE